MAIGLAQIRTTASTAASFDIPFNSPNAGGGVLTLELGAAARDPASAVVDSAGNTWQLASFAAVDAGSGPATEIWYAKNAIGGTNTVTVTSNSSGVNVGCAMQEWSGLSTSAPLEMTWRLEQHGDDLGVRVERRIHRIEVRHVGEEGAHAELAETAQQAVGAAVDVAREHGVAGRHDGKNGRRDRAHARTPSP